MRGLQKIIHELKDIVQSHHVGDALELPKSLPSMEIDGRRLAYVVAGLERSADTSPVVLLHGFGGFFMDWPRVMAPLARHTRVYALDLPGWGFSEPNHGARTLEDEVRIVNEFLSQLGLNNVILCGLSYGGGVAWAAAAMHLPRVRRAVLLNPIPPHPLRYMHSPLYRSIFFLNRFAGANYLGHHLLNKSQYKIICRENLLNDRLLDSFYLDLAYMVIKQPKMLRLLAAHALGARTIKWADWEHRLAGVKIPVSILQAQNDRLFSIKSAQVLHRLIPTSELIEIEDCGHAMVFDQHRKVSDFIIRHIVNYAQDRESHESVEKNLRSEA